jgi:predicted short-subunit dehydrogenase-like oxidoreductase (DUF2520 family)
MVDKQNFSIAFVGSGKIVHSLLPAIRKNGYNVVQIIGKDPESVESLSGRWGIPRFSYSLSDLKYCNLVMIAVPDDRIVHVASELSKLKLPFEKINFLHFSGSLDSSLLRPLKEKGANIASFHVMQTFSDYEPVNIEGSVCAVESVNENLRKILFDIAIDLKLKPFEISSSDKLLYHIIGVIGVNFLSANFYNAAKLSESISSDIDLGSLLRPIVVQKINNILKNGAVKALSGPVERGDTDIIEKHIEELKDHRTVLLNYIASSLTLVDVALEKGSIDSATASEMRSLLKGKLSRLINSENNL